MAEEKYEWRTSISTYSDKEIVIRGYDIEDLIENVDFASVVYLAMKGELPTNNQAKVLNTLLVSVIDHGIAPSEMVTRYVAASGVPLQGCIAAGMLTIGDVHGGAGEAFAKMIQTNVQIANEEGIPLAEMADKIINKAKAEGRRLEGFGHPMHPGGDPRAPKLIEMAKKYEVAGPHIELAERLEEALEKSRNRKIPMNIDGASGAIISDLGLSWRFARPILLISRTAGLASHAVEEIEREKAWRSVDKDKILYDGPEKREINGTNS